MCTEACPCYKDSTAFSKYNKWPETYLNSFNRTKSNISPFIPFVWTTDKNKGFNSFKECMDTTNVKLEKSMEKTGHYEEKYDCVGLCRPALFYYSKPLKNGIPKKTCSNFVRNVIRDHAQPYGVCAILTALVASLMFPMHFGLYCRPLPPPTEQEVNQM
jgi:hypothetical protein